MKGIKYINFFCHIIKDGNRSKDSFLKLNNFYFQTFRHPGFIKDIDEINNNNQYR